MTNDVSNSDDDGKIDLSKKPTAKEEAQDFSNADDKRKGQDYAHELALLYGKQGPIGKLIGCSDSALTIAFILLSIGGLAMLGDLLLMLKDSATFGPIFKDILALEGTVAGYVFGKKTSDHE